MAPRRRYNSHMKGDIRVLDSARNWYVTEQKASYAVYLVIREPLNNSGQPMAPFDGIEDWVRVL